MCLSHTQLTPAAEIDTPLPKGVIEPFLTQEGVLEGQLQHCFLHLLGDSVLDGGPSPAFLLEDLYSPFLIGLSDPVEGVPPVAHHSAGF